jgi:hypothetical protein
MWQVPFTQDDVAKKFEHAVPQAPQWLKLVWRLMQAPLHRVIPAGHAHVPAAQVAPVGHALVHEPQFLGSLDKLTHAPPHTDMPAGQAHVPPAQVAPVGHAVVHEPQ